MRIIQAVEKFYPRSPARIHRMVALRFRPSSAAVISCKRFVEGSWLTPLVNGFSRAIPLRYLSAFTAKVVPWEGEAPRPEVGAGLAVLKWLRQQMDAAGRQTQRLVSLHDGSYDTLDFWGGLPAPRGFPTVPVTRTARNRCLYALPAPDAHGNCK